MDATQPDWSRLGFHAVFVIEANSKVAYVSAQAASVRPGWLLTCCGTIFRVYGDKPMGGCCQYAFACRTECLRLTPGDPNANPPIPPSYERCGWRYDGYYPNIIQDCDYYKTCKRLPNQDPTAGWVGSVCE